MLVRWSEMLLDEILVVWRDGQLSIGSASHDRRFTSGSRSYESLGLLLFACTIHQQRQQDHLHTFQQMQTKLTVWNQHCCHFQFHPAHPSEPFPRTRGLTHQLTSHRSRSKQSSAPPFPSKATHSNPPHPSLRASKEARTNKQPPSFQHQLIPSALELTFFVHSRPSTGVCVRRRSGV
jgi:hypothetical protein